MDRKWMTADPLEYALLKENAKKNRQNATEAESVFWSMVKASALGQRCIRQHIIPKRSLGLVDLMTVLVLIYIAEKFYNIVRNESTTPSRCFSSSTTRTQCILF